jgi:hypothetical protein
VARERDNSVKLDSGGDQKGIWEQVNESYYAGSAETRLQKYVLMPMLLVVFALLVSVATMKWLLLSLVSLVFRRRGASVALLVGHQEDNR